MEPFRNNRNDALQKVALDWEFLDKDSEVVAINGAN
jgi:hypothetical protein